MLVARHALENEVESLRQRAAKLTSGRIDVAATPQEFLTHEVDREITL